MHEGLSILLGTKSIRSRRVGHFQPLKTTTCYHEHPVMKTTPASVPRSLLTHLCLVILVPRKSTGQSPLNRVFRTESSSGLLSTESRGHSRMDTVVWTESKCGKSLVGRLFMRVSCEQSLPDRVVCTESSGSSLLDRFLWNVN